jgi:hypothetical protein
MGGTMSIMIADNAISELMRTWDGLCEKHDGGDTPASGDIRDPLRRFGLTRDAVKRALQRSMPPKPRSVTPCDDLDREVLKYIRDRGSVRALDLMQAFSVGSRRIGDAVNHLRSEGHPIVRRSGSAVVYEWGRVSGN